MKILVLWKLSDARTADILPLSVDCVSAMCGRSSMAWVMKVSAITEKGDQMSSKSKRKPKSFSMHKAVSVAMTIFVWAWMSCFHPTQEDVNKLSAEVANIRESVGNGNLNVWMVRDAIKDEFGWEI